VAERAGLLAETAPGRDDDCGPGLQRVNYAAAMLLGVDDFKAEQECLRSRMRRHNRLLHGAHGVFAPASPERARIVPATRAAAANPTSPHGATSTADCSPNLSWAQRLERVFAIDIETCRHCGGRLRVIASIEQPALIERILGHLGRVAGAVDPGHPSRAPPGRSRLI